ncbi:uncharacterized protein BN452_01915 [Clostridium sp. CAG:1013]|nr:uncharacterized protein BN452_01915 [Clostridium sp. CAG:1013]
MDQTHSGRGLVNLLSAGAAGAVHFHLNILGRNLHRVVQLHFRHDFQGSKRGLPSACRVKGRHTHQPVHTCLALQITVGVLSLHHDGSALQTSLVSVQVVQSLHFVAVTLRPAVVHAEQHLRPVLGLRAAGTGVEGQNSVILIVFPGEQSGQLHGSNLTPDRFDLRFRFFHQREVLRLVAHLDESHAVPCPAQQFLICVVLVFQRGHPLGHFLGQFHVVPKTGLGRLVLQHVHLFPQLFQTQGLPQILQRLFLFFQLPFQFFKLQHSDLSFVVRVSFAIILDMEKKSKPYLYHPCPNREKY